MDNPRTELSQKQTYLGALHVKVRSDDEEAAPARDVGVAHAGEVGVADGVVARRLHEHVRGRGHPRQAEGRVAAQAVRRRGRGLPDGQPARREELRRVRRARREAEHLRQRGLLLVRGGAGGRS